MTQASVSDNSDADLQEHSHNDPDFLVIGAQKAATTWVKYILDQHPDIFIPATKEIHFFNKRYNYTKGLSWYRSHFADNPGASVIGEVTPNYLWTSSKDLDLKESRRTSGIPGLVYKHYPDIKLIAILRDPVHRAISAFRHHIRDRFIAPGANIIDVGEHRGIFSMGYYDVDLKSWFDFFPRDQFKILIFEETINKIKQKTVNELFDFLGLEVYPVKNLEQRHNSTEGDLYIRLHYYFPRLAKGLKYLIPSLMNLDYPEIKVTKEDIRKLKELYRPHNKRLERMLGRSLPWEGI